MPHGSSMRAPWNTPFIMTFFDPDFDTAAKYLHGHCSRDLSVRHEASVAGGVVAWLANPLHAC